MSCKKGLLNLLVFESIDELEDGQYGFNAFKCPMIVEAFALCIGCSGFSLLLLAFAIIVPCHEFIDRWFDFLFEFRYDFGVSSDTRGEWGRADP